MNLPPVNVPRRRAGWIAVAICLMLPQLTLAAGVYPKHITSDVMLSVRRGLDYLAETQGQNGSWGGTDGSRAYPVTMTSLAGMAFLANGNTPTRGRYAEQVKKTSQYLVRCGRSNGLITSPSEESGRPMYGHGFALTFLSTVYGMETHERTRNEMKEVIVNAIALTGAAQSADGGWTYVPGGGDEGSVTITQIQALRAAENAGFHVPKGVIEKAIRYIERCQTTDGGIRYSLRSGNRSQLAISTAAVASLYNAGEYDSPMAESCLRHVFAQFKGQSSWSGGHAYYTNFYGAQAFYLASDEHWDAYFPKSRDYLLQQQNAQKGYWSGDGIGTTYGTAIALIVLQLPFKFLPIYQR